MQASFSTENADDAVPVQVILPPSLRNPGPGHSSSARESPRRFFSASVRLIMTWCPHPVHFKRKSCPIRRTSQVYAPQGCGFFSLMISPTRISIPLIPPALLRPVKSTHGSGTLCIPEPRAGTSLYARSFPVIMVKASLYFALVFSTTSSGRRKSLSGFAFSQLRTNCLSKDGCPWPAS